MAIEQLQRFKDKSIFITGHTGFKGSWLTYWLSSLGARVKGFSLAPSTQPNLFSQLGLFNTIESITGDVNDLIHLKKEVESFQPDYIFHLAAQPLVRKSYKEPVATFQTNVTGTANLLESVRLLDKPCICICITTDKVYHNHEWIYPYRENDRLGGYDPYSASKACAELVISSYTNSFFNIKLYNKHGKAVASARAGNVIGGGDWSEDRLIPDIAKALSKGEEVIIRNPAAVRPWQHVLEPLLGYMHLALSIESDVSKYTGSWNFGPFAEDNFSVHDLASMAVDIWGAGVMKFGDHKDSPHEAGLLRLDISKATGELKWTPKMRASEAIQRTIQWYKSYYNGSEAAALVDADLTYYQSLFV